MASTQGLTLLYRADRPQEIIPFSKVKGPTSAQQDSLFMTKMPAELRNRIYGYVLEGFEVKIPEDTTAGLTTGYPDMLLVCKHIHFEAIRIYYKNATFLAVDRQMDRLKAWVEAIGVERKRCITTLHVFQDYRIVQRRWRRGPMSLPEIAQETIDRAVASARFGTGFVKCNLFVDCRTQHSAKGTMWTASSKEECDRIMSGKSGIEGYDTEKAKVNLIIAAIWALGPFSTVGKR